MTTTVTVPPIFQKRLKSLKKKYPTVSNEVRQLIETLQTDERPGERASGTGYAVYKTRLPYQAARRGKSGGFRVIYFVQLADSVTLLTIYAKTEQTDISVREIQQLVAEVSG